MMAHAFPTLPDMANSARSGADGSPFHLPGRAPATAITLRPPAPRLPMNAHLAFHSLLEQREHRRFLRRQPRERRPQLRFRARFQSRDERTVHIRVNYTGMNVALAADRLGVSQSLGHSFNGLGNVALGCGLRIEIFEFLERPSS